MREKLGDERVLIARFDGQRRQGERGGRGIAAGRGDVPGGTDLGAVQLRQPEREPVEQVGCGVLLVVPGLVVGVGQPEVGAQVDDVTDRIDERASDGLRLPVGQRQEDDVEAREISRVEGRVRKVVRSSEGGEQLADRRAHVRVGRHHDDLDLWVPREEAQQLRTRVAGPADDRSSIRHDAYYT